MPIYPPTPNYMFPKAEICIVARHQRSTVAPPFIANADHVSPGYVEHEAPRMGPKNRKPLKLICTTKSLSEDGVPIRSIRIPKGWIQIERSSRWAYSYTYGYKYGFKPFKDSQVKLCIYWNGNPINEDKRATWLEILKKPPHDLTQNELDFLKDGIITEDADPEYFKLRTARTVSWNGRMVIETEGETIVSRNPVIQSFTITYDRGDGFCHGSVYFSGQKEDYAKHIDKAREAMKSIQWVNNASRD